MPKKDYPYLRAWCWMMGSSRDYTEDQIERARQENAPDDAIYEKFASDGTGRTGEWARFANVTREDTRLLIENFVTEYNANMAKENRNG